MPEGKKLILLTGKITALLCTLGIVALFFSACNGDSLEGTSAILSPPLTDTLIPTSSHTPRRTPTKTITPTATKTPTITLTPSITPTPTEDLSFYDVISCLPQNTSYQKGIVTNVEDGDSIMVQSEDRQTITVRYIGIDAPENGYPFFEEGRKANSDLVLQKKAILIKDRSEADQYQRWLRYVIVDGVFVNLELIRSGFARAQSYPPDEACKAVFIAAEEEARLASRGMWTATQTPDPSSGRVTILAVNKKAEWVEIQNVGHIDVDLSGWNLVSERGHQDCPLSGTIKAGEVWRIWSMQAQGAGYSCGYSSPIWNNSEPDPAVLYNAQGAEVSRK